MTTAYLIGYLVLCVVVLVGANALMRAKKKTPDSEVQPASPVQADASVEGQATPEAEAQEWTDHTYEPIPQPTEEFLEAVTHLDENEPTLVDNLRSLAEGSHLPPRSHRHKTDQPALVELEHHSEQDASAQGLAEAADTNDLNPSVASTEAESSAEKADLEKKRSDLSAEETPTPVAANQTEATHATLTSANVAEATAPLSSASVEEGTTAPPASANVAEATAPLSSASVEEGTTTPPASASVAEATTAPTAPPAESKGPEINVGRLLTVLLLGAFVAILNQTLINVALPHMMNDLNVSANVIQWLVTGYMLVNGVLIPITAYLIERFGARKLFLAAMGLFTIGAVICSIAPNFSVMLIGRLVQASGAGIIMPLMMTVFLTVFPPEKRGKAMGLMGIAMIFAPAIGPTLSGYIVQNYSWRILFYFVIPIGLLDLALAAAWMRNISKTSRPKFDLAGFLFSTIGFGGILYGFSEAGSDGWMSGPVLFSLIFGGLSLIAFVWRQLTAEQPMLNLRVFKYDVFTLTTIISSLVNMAMFAAMILLPIYLQNIRGFTPLQSGLLMLPGAILMGVMMPISGAIFDRIGARALAITGLIITVITTWEFTHLTDETTYGTLLLLYCLRMFGMSFIMMPIQTAGMNQLPRNLHSHGTATGNTARQVAGSLGTALLVTIMSSRASFHMANYTNEVTSTNPLLAQKVAMLGQGVAATAGLPSSAGQSVITQLLYGQAMKDSTIAGINDAFMYATGFAVVALVLSFFIKHVKIQKKK